MLSQEVAEKQMLVMALESQKSSITKELQDKIEEIKSHRHLIQKKIKMDQQLPSLLATEALQSLQKEVPAKKEEP